MDMDRLDHRQSIADVVWVRGRIALDSNEDPSAGRHRFSKQSTSTIDTKIMVPVTGNMVAVIAEAAICPCRQPVRAPAAPAQPETADVTNHQNV
jgi:hypothetical protein